jgi:hypothetical protein
MNRHSLRNTLFAFGLAILMAIQSVALHQFPNSSNISDKETLTETFLSDYAQHLPLMLKGGNDLNPIAKFNFQFGNATFPYFELLQFHFESGVRSKISLTNSVELAFGVKEIIFPFHFFW